MSYIGNSPTTTAFVTDTFNGNGSTTAFTMSVAPAATSAVLVAISGVLQDPSTYSVAGTTLTFSAAPPSGTGNISCRYLGIPASGVATTAYRTVTEFTATSGQTTFTPPSYTVGFINVYRNGARLGTADYTATNGTTVVLAVGAVAGDLVAVESFYVSSVLNAIPNTAGAVQASNLAAGAARANFGAGAVLQVVQGVLSSAFYSSAVDSWVDIGLQASITPVSATSKILVTANIGRGGRYSQAYALYRNGTQVMGASGDTSGSGLRAWFGFATNDGTHIESGGAQYLDSPATATALTYKLYAQNYHSGVYVNQSTAGVGAQSYLCRTISTLTLMEIAA